MPLKMFNLKFIHKCKQKQRTLQHRELEGVGSWKLGENQVRLGNEREGRSPGVRHSALIPTTTIKVEPNRNKKERPIAVVPIDIPASSHSSTDAVT